MKTLKGAIGVLCLIGAVLCLIGAVLGAATLLFFSAAAPQIESIGNVLEYVSIALVASFALVIVSVFPRIYKVVCARGFGQASYERAFSQFKKYCEGAQGKGNYIGRLLLFIFTVLVIAALVVKGSVAVAVLLTVAYFAAGALRHTVRQVGYGKVGHAEFAQGL